MGRGRLVCALIVAWLAVVAATEVSWDEPAATEVSWDIAATAVTWENSTDIPSVEVSARGPIALGKGRLVHTYLLHVLATTGYTILVADFAEVRGLR